MNKLKQILKNSIKAAIGYFQNLERYQLPDAKIEKIIIGESLKSKEISCYKIGDGEKKIIFVSCMHGNEVGTVKLAYKLISFLQDNGYNRFSFYIVPCLNPDGYNVALQNPDYSGGGRKGRFNANNVDLNRNFPTDDWAQKSVWSYGNNYSQKDEVFGGEFAGSEPEIKALCKFVQDNGIKILFSFHNAGRDVMGNNNEISRELIKIYSTTTGFKLISESDWEKMSQTGTAKKWCDENGVVYVEVECSNRWGSDWNRQREAIISCIEYLK